MSHRAVSSTRLQLQSCADVSTQITVRAIMRAAVTDIDNNNKGDAVVTCKQLPFQITETSCKCLAQCSQPCVISSLSRQHCRRPAPPPPAELQTRRAAGWARRHRVLGRGGRGLQDGDDATVVEARY